MHGMAVIETSPPTRTCTTHASRTRSRPLTPAHARSRPLTPAHARSRTLTLTLTLPSHSQQGVPPAASWSALPAPSYFASFIYCSLRWARGSGARRRSIDDGPCSEVSGCERTIFLCDGACSRMPDGACSQGACSACSALSFGGTRFERGPFSSATEGQQPTYPPTHAHARTHVIDPPTHRPTDPRPPTHHERNNLP